MGVEEIIFWQNHWKFSFVTLPQEIPGKASLLEFPKLVLHPLEIPMPISKTCGNSTWFFLDHPCKFLFLASPGISTFYLEIPCPFFSEIAHSHSYTDSYISSFWWVVNILLQKFDTLSKKNKFWRRKQHSYLYCELAPLTCDVTCLKL